MNDQRVAGIIQARLGSTRLPGKVLMPILNKPMLWHVLECIRPNKMLNKIVVATTDLNQDDAIASFCELNNVACFRGDAADVLDRYYQAARWAKADIVVRMTADCPLLDFKTIDLIVKTFLEKRGQVDYVSNTLQRSYPRGLDAEIFSFEGLSRSWREARQPYEREHVTPYFYQHPELFRLGHVVHHQDLSHMRWTVDEQRDLDFVRAVYERLAKTNQSVSFQNVLSLLEREPALQEINSGVEQKRVDTV